MNFVAPVAALTPTEQRTIEFGGLNRKPVVDEGEMSDMQNLSSDRYPLLSTRKARGSIELPDNVVDVIQIYTKYDKLCMIAETTEDKIRFFYDGEEIDAVGDLSRETRMVAINTRMAFFPEKRLYHLRDMTVSNIEATWQSLDTTWECKVESDKDIVYVNADEGSIVGEMKKDDAINITAHVSYGYYENKKGKSFPGSSGGTFTPGPSKPYFTRDEYGHYHTVSSITETQWGDGSKYYTQERFNKDIVESCEIKEIEYNEDIPGQRPSGLPYSYKGYIVTLPYNSIPEFRLQDAYDLRMSNASFKRECPNLKHVIEANNRLWGTCDDDNTIYSCKLGDPSNWHYYQGTSMDSYYAEQGSDGNWTGAANYGAHLLFFKEQTITKLYGSTPASYQTQTIIAPGVKYGCEGSIAVINDMAVYVGPKRVMAYDGGVPFSISEKLGDDIIQMATAGTDGLKYYLSAGVDDISTGKQKYSLYVCDIEKSLWHKEDDLFVTSFTRLNGEVVMAAYDELLIEAATDATEAIDAVQWSATFGPFDEYVENKKIYSKLSFRIASETEARFSVYISMDEGEWELVKEYEHVDKGGEYIPIVPRRCDRYSIKIQGEGPCEFKELTRRVRMGTGGKL